MFIWSSCYVCNCCKLLQLDDLTLLTAWLFCCLTGQDNISWTVGFAIPAVAMMVALALFLAGSSRYRHVAPTESPMARVVKVVYAALKARWSQPPGVTHPVSVIGEDDADSSLHQAMYYSRAQQQYNSSSNGSRGSRLRPSVNGHSMRDPGRGLGFRGCY